MSESRQTSGRIARSSARSPHAFNAFSAASQDQAGYVRARDLPRLLPLWPDEMNTASLSDHARLLARLRRALRAERQRGLAGNWTYDLARHAQLLSAYRTETADYLSRSGQRSEQHRVDGRS
jgi:hypothetical protein